MFYRALFQVRFSFSQEAPPEPFPSFLWSAGLNVQTFIMRARMINVKRSTNPCWKPRPTEAEGVRGGGPLLFVHFYRFLHHLLKRKIFFYFLFESVAKFGAFVRVGEKKI